MEIETRYVYIGKNIDLPDARLNKSGIYFGEKIEETRKKYPLLEKLLMKADDLSFAEKNEILLEQLTDELLESVKGENDGV